MKNKFATPKHLKSSHKSLSEQIKIGVGLESRINLPRESLIIKQPKNNEILFQVNFVTKFLKIFKFLVSRMNREYKKYLEVEPQREIIR